MALRDSIKAIPNQFMNKIAEIEKQNQEKLKKTAKEEIIRTTKYTIAIFPEAIKWLGSIEEIEKKAKLENNSEERKSARELLHLIKELNNLLKNKLTEEEINAILQQCINQIDTESKDKRASSGDRTE